MIELSQIKTFVLTADLGSLAAVSKQLGISPAAVSKQLTKLEQEVGVQLLNRSTRRVELTESGESYCSQCRRILEEVEEAKALISEVKATPSGTLRVVAGRPFGLTYIVPHIKEFLSLYPKIELNLELAERIPDLNKEAIDIMIGMSISATGDAIQKKIGTTTYCLCASKAYLKEFGVPKNLEDLKNHRYLAHSMRKPDIITANPYLRVNDSQALLDFALDGIGIAMLHEYVVREAIEKGALVELFKHEKKAQIPLYAAYPQRRYLASKVRCFIDFITRKI